MTCKTCKFWNVEEKDWQYDELKFGSCSAVRHRQSIELEIRDQFEDTYGDEAEAAILKQLQESKAFVVDSSGYYAALRTGPKFSCCLHERKK
jgi:hypothetical protein